MNDSSGTSKPRKYRTEFRASHEARIIGIILRIETSAFTEALLNLSSFAIVPRMDTSLWGRRFRPSHFYRLSLTASFGLSLSFHNLSLYL